MKAMTEKDAAGWLTERGLPTHPRSLRAIRCSGAIAFRLHGARVYYTEDDLLDYIERIKVLPDEKPARVSDERLPAPGSAPRTRSSKAADELNARAAAKLKIILES